MHELSIAAAIAEIAERQAAGRRVVGVEVKVGHLRQVVPESLRFAFELLSEGTALAGARIAIEQVPARGRCRRCDAESPIEGFPLRCWRCGGIEVDVTAGEELVVESIEIEEEDRQQERIGHGSHV